MPLFLDCSAVFTGDSAFPPRYPSLIPDSCSIHPAAGASHSWQQLGWVPPFPAPSPTSSFVKLLGRHSRD